jgi:valyl-tRNA synthetase
MDQLIRDVDRLFAAHQYGEAGRQIYEFFWSEFADWYLEISKLQMSSGGDRAFYTAQTLVSVLDTTLRLLHPFVPFITEELWGYLRDTCKAHPAAFSPKTGWKEALMIADWPKSTPIAASEESILQDFSLVMDIVRAIRNFRTEKNVKPGTKLEAVIAAGDRKTLVQDQTGAIAALAHLDKEKVTVIDRIQQTQAQPGIVISGVEIYLTLEEVINKEEEKQRLEAELKEVASQIERLQTLLGSSFAERAPAAVVEKEKQKLATFQQTAEKLKQQLTALK